jgi:phosphatidylglycerol---prolipoprotein diacylglyceryl transferase
VIPFLHIGPIEIPTFGLMVAAAMIVAYFVLRADLARRGIAEKNSSTAEMFIVIPSLVGIAGAKLYHVLETPQILFAHPREELLSRYGLAWFGGLIGGFAAWVWLSRRKKIPLLTSFDAGSAAATLGYGVGRIGCLLSGDGDYGVPTSLPWGMSFPNGLVPTTDTCVQLGWPATCRVHPTPIYELIIACLIAWILWKLGAKQIAATGEGATAKIRGRAEQAKAKKPPASAGPLPTSTAVWLQPGSVFAAYLLLTGLARFLVEFIRINPRSFFGMTNAQTASIGSVIAGLVLWWWSSRRATQFRG